MPRENQPIADIEWVSLSELSANDYNPNRVFAPEMELLKISLLEDGWTHPIVARSNGQIIDGFHRYRLAQEHPEILDLGDGMVPVVRLRDKTEAELMASTVRHNRARGQHGVLRMAHITRVMTETIGQAEVQKHLGMDRSEFERMTDERGSPERVGKEIFNKGWKPDVDYLAGKKRRHDATVARKRAAAASREKK